MDASRMARRRRRAQKRAAIRGRSADPATQAMQHATAQAQFLRPACGSAERTRNDGGGSFRIRYRQQGDRVQRGGRTGTILQVLGTANPMISGAYVRWDDDPGRHDYVLVAAKDWLRDGEEVPPA